MKWAADCIAFRETDHFQPPSVWLVFCWHVMLVQRMVKLVITLSTQEWPLPNNWLTNDWLGQIRGKDSGIVRLLFGGLNNLSDFFFRKYKFEITVPNITCCHWCFTCFGDSIPRKLNRHYHERWYPVDASSQDICSHDIYLGPLLLTWINFNPRMDK